MPQMNMVQALNSAMDVMLARDPALVQFVKMVSSITRGRAYFTNTMSLGQFILMDFLKRKTRKVS